MDAVFALGYRSRGRRRIRGPARDHPHLRNYGADPFPLRPSREAGLIKSSPQKNIAEKTDWRLLNELKRELKA
jgi:hypothetical protein